MSAEMSPGETGDTIARPVGAENHAYKPELAEGLDRIHLSEQVVAVPCRPATCAAGGLPGPSRMRPQNDAEELSDLYVRSSVQISSSISL
jgi:hypothetical protein